MTGTTGYYIIGRTCWETVTITGITFILDIKSHIMIGLLNIDQLVKYVMRNSRSSYATKGRYYAILQAAEKLFGEKGYQNVSIDEIARTAGVAKGLVNYHFGNKETLLIHVLSKGTTTMFAELDTVISKQKTAKSKVRAAVEMYLSVASAGPGLTRMAMMAVFEASYSESIRKLWLDFMDQNLSKFNDLIDEGVANGEFKPVDSQFVTQLVMAMAFEILRTATLKQETLDPKGASEKVTKILFEGICT